MTDPAPPPAPGQPHAGGFAIAGGITLGVVGGLIVGQPSAGFLIGLLLGVAIAIWLWRR